MSNDVINVINITKKKTAISVPKKPSTSQANSKGASTLNFITNPVILTAAAAASVTAGGGINVNNSNNQYNFHCRLCNIDGHSTLYCPAYPYFENRKARCVELSLCCLCTSLTHKTADCHGNSNQLKVQCRFCNNYKHLSGMCPSRPSLSIGKTSSYVC